MIKARVLFCAALCLLTACAAREELAGGLDAKQSIEIMVALKNSGITADRDSTGTGRAQRYSVTVSRSEFSRSLEVLKEYGLPRSDEESFDRLTGADDLIPNVAAISQLRLDRALSLEIERVIQLLPNVVDVRAVVRSHLVPPEEDGRFREGSQPKSDGNTPRATVVVRYVARSGNQPFSSDEIRQRVVDAVPGLALDRVTVTTSRLVLSGAGEIVGRADANSPVVQLTEVEPFSFLVPSQDRRRVLALIAAMLVLFSFASGVVGFALAVALRKRRVAASSRVVKSAVLEASYRGQPGTPNAPATQSQRGGTGTRSQTRPG